MKDQLDYINNLSDSDDSASVEYLLMCLRMSPEARLKKGFELSEWAIKLNKINGVIEEINSSGCFRLSK